MYKKKEERIIEVVKNNNQQKKTLSEWLQIANNHLGNHRCTTISFVHVLSVMHKTGKIDLEKHRRYYTLSLKEAEHGLV